MRGFQNNWFSKGFYFSCNLNAVISQFQRLQIWALCHFFGQEDHRPPPPPPCPNVPVRLFQYCHVRLMPPNE